MRNIIIVIKMSLLQYHDVSAAVIAVVIIAVMTSSLDLPDQGSAVNLPFSCVFMQIWFFFADRIFTGSSRHRPRPSSICVTSPFVSATLIHPRSFCTYVAFSSKLAWLVHPYLRHLIIHVRLPFAAPLHWGCYKRIPNRQNFKDLEAVEWVIHLDSSSKNYNLLWHKNQG